MQYQHLQKAFGEEELQTLSEKTVSVVGLGGIGSALAELLVRSGISVRVIEKDRILEEDLDRLSMFTNKHVSKFKATEAKKILNKINPEVQVKSFNEEITEQSLFLMDADVVLDCTGDHEITPIISDYCLSKKIPCVAGGIRDTKCIVITGTKKESVYDQLEKLSFDKTEGIIPAAGKVIAGFMYVNTLKLLLGKKIKQTVLVYDLWEGEMVSTGKKPVKKKSASKKKPAKKASSKKKTASKKSASKKAPAKKSASKKKSAKK